MTQKIMLTIILPPKNDVHIGCYGRIATKQIVHNGTIYYRAGQCDGPAWYQVYLNEDEYVWLCHGCYMKKARNKPNWLGIFDDGKMPPFVLSAYKFDLLV